MGFLKKLFGGKEEKPPERYPAHPVPPGKEDLSDRPEVNVDELTAKQLVRLVGIGDKRSRAKAAEKLAELGDRTALRPLMNSYLSHGDPEVLEALRIYGDQLTTPAVREAQDPGVVGERRVRMMDILSITGSEEAVIAVRANVDPQRNSPEIHTRACVALARLGDESRFQGRVVSHRELEHLLGSKGEHCFKTLFREQARTKKRDREHEKQCWGRSSTHGAVPPWDPASMPGEPAACRIRSPQRSKTPARRLVNRVRIR